MQIRNSIGGGRLKARIAQLLINLGLVFNVSSIFQHCDWPCKFKVAINSSQPIEVILGEQNQVVVQVIDKPSNYPLEYHYFTVTFDPPTDFPEELTALQDEHNENFNTRIITVPIWLTAHRKKMDMYVSLNRKHFGHSWFCQKQKLSLELNTRSLEFNAWGLVQVDNGNITLNWHGKDEADDLALSQLHHFFNIQALYIPMHIAFSCLAENQKYKRVYVGERFLTLYSKDIRDHKITLCINLVETSEFYWQQILQNITKQEFKNKFILTLVLESERCALAQAQVEVNLLPWVCAQLGQKDLATTLAKIELLAQDSALTSKTASLTPLFNEQEKKHLLSKIQALQTKQVLLKQKFTVSLYKPVAGKGIDQVVNEQLDNIGYALYMAEELVGSIKQTEIA